MEASSVVHVESAPRGRLCWLGLAAQLALAVVGWEYLLTMALRPADWSPKGVAAHAALDLALVLPVVALALLAGLKLARRLGMSPATWAGLLGIAGLASSIYLASMAPVVVVRDPVHEWMGKTYGLSLAKSQADPAQAESAAKAAKPLCSFGSLANPSFAGDPRAAIPVAYRAAAAASALLTQLAALLPLLLLGLFLRLRSALPRPDLARAMALLRWWARPLRLASVAAAALLGVCAGGGMTSGYAQMTSHVAGDAAPPYNACTAGGPLKEYDVHAINVEVTINRYGDHYAGFMYALASKIPAIRAQEQALADARAQMVAANDVNLAGVTRVTPGLRNDPIQPLVIRGNLGDCVRIHLTNDLTDGQPASLHLLGLSHTVQNAGSAVGNNPSSFAAPGQTVTYEIPLPLDPSAERAYYFHDHGAGRRRVKFGLFGTLIAEPRGATYLDVETGQPLDTVTGNSWEAIIIDPNLDNRPDGKSFREFTIIYHEVGDEALTPIHDFDGGVLPLLDSAALSASYRPGTRAINYRSEPFRRRIEFNNLINGTAIQQGRSLGYSSYPFGDPATPIPRSYVGEATKTRLVHGGSEVFHVHHLHGGADRWRRNPKSDPNNNFWKGLTKVPEQNLQSVELDSQSVGPGGSYNLEHECGAGGCQQAVGDFLYHCHIGHHYFSGMWSFWRVFGTVQTAQTDLAGHPLYVEPRLFQHDNVFSDSEAASNTPPSAGVSAGQLIGVQVDFGRTIVDDANLTNPQTQVGLRQWITGQLPPQGARLDNNDATTWDWIFSGSGSELKVLGEPEETHEMAGWTSPAPGQRPEVLFNPKNARYAWPLFRPHAAARPPFTARHTGAPYLGEDMIPGRMDGLCAHNGVHAGVDVGPTAVKRSYPVSSIGGGDLPIQVTKDKTDPNGEIFVLNEDEADIRNHVKPAQPLAIRSNVGDCVEVTFTNKIPDGPLNSNYSKVNIHSHFVQFDPQASDGVISGFSYEQSLRPFATENRTLVEDVSPNGKTLKVSQTNRLRVGVWIGIGLGLGTCGTDSSGQPLPCTEVRQITAINNSNIIKLDQPLQNHHAAGEAVGVEFVRYDWYSDADVGTVFFHEHVDFHDWDHGLFGAHIVEPRGSTYHDPTTGAEIRAGTLADIRVAANSQGQPVATNVPGSFREFMLFLQDNNVVEGQFRAGGGVINLRAEPWRLRPGDPAYRFSSVQFGDPITPTVRAYVGDPVVVRGLGLIERVGGVRFTGHRFNIERKNANSSPRDANFLGISERYDFALEGGAGGTGGFPGDYLYYSTLGRDFSSGGWGLLRVYDALQGNLQPLPDRPAPNGSSGFPQLAPTNQPPPSLADGPGNPCPPGAPVRSYALAVADTTVVYNDTTLQNLKDTTGVAYHLDGAVTSQIRSPMVLRANQGECLEVALNNLRTTNRSGLSVGQIPFDPQRSYGAAIGLNYDSTTAPGTVRTYRYYADKEVGLALALNLGDIDSVKRGGFAGVVVEPAGSTYRQPGLSDPLPGGGTGVQADIVNTGGLATREFVSLITDIDNTIGEDVMPYPSAIAGFTGMSYSAEPLSLRGITTAPADVFRSDLFGDPRYVVTVPAGAATIVRVGVPWGEQIHIPAVEGHRFRQEPGMTNSETLFDDVLAPGMALNWNLLGGAGGDLRATGDYLIKDGIQPFLEAGLWGILRVTDPQTGLLASHDQITVQQIASGKRGTSLQGVVSTRPVGDTVARLAVYDGAEAKGACTGNYLGTVAVDPGNGRFMLRLKPGAAPSHLCLQSPAGGVASGATADLVPPRARRRPELHQPLLQEVTTREFIEK